MIVAGAAYSIQYASYANFLNWLVEKSFHPLTSTE
jgi:hypothetical protein